MAQLMPFQRFVGRRKEVGVADRLQQIVEGIHFIAIQGILLEGGGEDHTGLLG